jgi:hypothetical protein
MEMEMETETETETEMESWDLRSCKHSQSYTMALLQIC